MWAAEAAAVQAIDSVFSDANDADGLRAETELIKRLGFTRRDGTRLHRAIETRADYLPLVERWNDEYRRIGLTMGGVADLMAVTFTLFFTLHPRHPVTIAHSGVPTA